MPNIFEAVTNLIKTYTDEEQKSPLHVGEVMSLWTYYVALAAADAFEQTALNTTKDHDLKGALEDALKMCKSQTKRLQLFMQSEGIPLPPIQQEKPDSDSNSIPMGVKMTDDEIANGLSLKVAGAAISCVTGASESIRNDVSQMLTEFLMEEMMFGVTLKTLLRKRGWLKIPPYYTPPGLPDQ